MQKELLSIEVMCNEKTMLLHMDGIVRLVRNYLANQAYDTNEYIVKVEQKGK